MPNQNTQIGKLDRESRSIGVLYSGDPSHMQRQTQAQNKRMEEDLPSKWRTKKQQELQSQSLIKQMLNQQRIKRDKEGHYIMVKGSMQQKELRILNIYTSNTGVLRYIKQVLNDLQRDVDSHTIRVGDFNIPLSILDGSMRQKINKDIQDFELRYGPSKPSRHVWNSPPQIHRMYILLSITSHLL